VAIAGPLVNVAIFIFLAMVLLATGYNLENLEELKINGNTILLYFASANLVLALFNMLPAFPMDGGRVLRALLSIKLPRAQATKIAGNIGQVLALVFVFYGLFNNPILVLIGVFIFLGASSEVNYTQQQSMLKGYKVKDAIMTDIQVIGFDAPLAKAIEKLLDSQATHFVVVRDDVATGILSRNEIIKGLQEGNENTTVESVANFQPYKIETEQDLDDAWSKMLTQKQKVAFVYENGHFMGILDQENISEFIMVKSALKKI
jgi:CBS domain-containing protein